MFRVTSKELIFFDMFVEGVENACKAAGLLLDLMTDYRSVHEKVRNIETCEHDGDKNVHDILHKLNQSFITPIDREDIDFIARELDNITDAIEATAHRFTMFNVVSIKEDAITLAKLIVQCTKELRDLMVELKNMKRSTTLQQKVIEVNRIENEGDDIYRSAITKLFVTEKDAIEIVKWKEIYEFLENTLDACEDVADSVEGVVMKHA
ncbi:MAG: DUF47 family protein [Clostridiales bacterium]|nr:DUF47 family protein [Eubacteriales bacterium]MDH7567027.1 DUF47 family protein [Clostridiales bacterium]